MHTSRLMAAAASIILACPRRVPSQSMASKRTSVSSTERQTHQTSSFPKTLRSRAAVQSQRTTIRIEGDRTITTKDVSRQGDIKGGTLRILLQGDDDAAVVILRSTIANSVTIDTGIYEEEAASEDDDEEAFSLADRIAVYAVTLESPDGLKITGNGALEAITLCSIYRSSPTPDPSLAYIQTFGDTGFLDDYLEEGDNTTVGVAGEDKAYTGLLEEQAALCANRRT